MSHIQSNSKSTPVHKMSFLAPVQPLFTHTGVFTYLAWLDLFDCVAVYRLSLTDISLHC